MLPIHIEKNLEMLDPNKYAFVSADGNITLVETKTNGWANLKCIFSKDSIVFYSPDKNVMPYLRAEKKYGCKSCPDAFIYQKENDANIWSLHIIEFKRTIDLTKLNKSKQQFKMGIYNARAIAALLGFTLETIIVYSAYRNDKTVNKADTIGPRAMMHNTESIIDWNNDICTLIVDEAVRKYPHVKIHLNEDDGTGNTTI